VPTSTHLELMIAGALTLLAGCENKPAATVDGAVGAVTTWVPDGVKGDVRVSAVTCTTSDSARFACTGNVTGGGKLVISAMYAAGSWSMKLVEPIIVAARVENLIRDHHAGLGVMIMPACGDRVRPAKKGDVFKCLIRDQAGKEVSAAEVTITEASVTDSKVSVKALTELVDREALEQEIGKWLGDNDVTGKVSCPPPRRHFSVPDTTFRCDVEGIDKQVQVKVTDYRAKASWGWAED
jgi:hypothetical protein